MDDALSRQLYFFLGLAGFGFFAALTWTGYAILSRRRRRLEAEQTALDRMTMALGLPADGSEGFIAPPVAAEGTGAGSVPPAFAQLSREEQVVTRLRAMGLVRNVERRVALPNGKQGALIEMTDRRRAILVWEPLEESERLHLLRAYECLISFLPEDEAVVTRRLGDFISEQVDRRRG